ncbi:SDR family NAD(P)-dependent oxidoreductase [Desulfosarcina sp.]|uniref:SDR family NAD(P)-dependent oxidoreductase n=1 Tax=Desulfosarcina sp. TaxID=2027861 RepID=UPI003970F7BE
MGKMFSGKTAVVTGSGKRSGIGYAVARKLAVEGANVVIADLGLNPDPDLAVKAAGENEMADIARELAQTHDVESLAVNLDVTRADSVARMAETIAARFGKIHILVNNAGASFGVPNAVHTYDETAWMKTIDVNLHGVFRVSRALLPLMIPGGGAIVNTASRAGKVPALFNGAYAVAKAGVIMLTKIMALELAGNGVRVNAVCPGQIATDLEKWRFGLEAQFFGSTIEEREKEMCKTIPLGRIGSPDEVGDLVAFLASDRAAYMTGQAINITGGQLMEL